MSDKLKPCPFCGGEDIGIRTRYIKETDGFMDEEETRCGCESCNAGVTEETRAEAIEAWNRRTL